MERLGALGDARAAGDHLGARRILAEVSVKVPMLFRIPGVWPILAKSPPRFIGVGEGRAYVDYLHDLLRLADAAARGAEVAGDATAADELCRTLAQSFDFRLASHSDHDIGPMMRLRAGLMRRALPAATQVFTKPLKPFDPARTRPRFAVLLRSLAEDPESTSLLPFFEGARQAGFSVTVFTFRDHRSDFRTLIEQAADSIVELPGDIVAAASRIRAEDADLLLFASDVTAKPSIGAFLAFLRLARIQMTAVSTLMTTQSPMIDVYLGSPGHRAIGADAEFSERYIDVPSPGFAFRFAPGPAPRETFSRAELGLDEDAVILVSGANHTKLHRDVLDTWARILAAAPRSVLLLYPFPRHFAVDAALRDHVERPFAEAGIDPARVRLMPQLAGRDVVKRLLAICDLGLDSFPYPGVTTMVDALEARLPTVSLRGRTLRTNQGAEVLGSVGMGELVASDMDAYRALAIELAKDDTRRGEVRARLEAAMAQPPMALDPDRFAAATAAVLVKLVGELRDAATAQPPPDAAPARRTVGGKLETMILARPDGGRICVHRMPGSGPEIVLLGGYGRASPLRKPIGAETLSHCRRLGLGFTTIEVRGQGGSGGELQRQTPETMRDDVLGVCHDLGISDAIGIGASLGGWIILAAQTARPTLLRAALLLAPAIDWDRHFLLPAIASGRGIAQPEGDIAFPADNLLIGRAFMDGVDALRLPADRIDIPGPIAIVQGGRDSVVPLTTATDFVARYGASTPITLRVVPAEGHGLSALSTPAASAAFAAELDTLIAACHGAVQRVAPGP
jgi:pimeloyl-ACP methyl ester carboxylesterase